MAYVIPEFPIVCRVYATAVVPPVVAPRASDVPCNLAVGRRVNVVSTGGTSTPGVLVAAVYLLTPKDHPLHGPEFTGQQDTVEVPQGSGRWYQVMAQDAVGMGFPNEHRVAWIYAWQKRWAGF